MQFLPQPGDGGRDKLQVSDLLAVIICVSNTVCFQDAVNLPAVSGRRPGGLGALRRRVFDEVTQNFSRK